jgi:hypothetical protein
MEGLWRELKALAQAQGRGLVPLDVLGGGLGRSFGHFPSRVLSPDSRLGTGPMASPFLAGHWARQPMLDLAQALPSQGLERLLAALEQRGGQASLGQLFQDLAGQFLPHQVEHLALWGLKYGLLSLA